MTVTLRIRKIGRFLLSILPGPGSHFSHSGLVHLLFTRSPLLTKTHISKRSPAHRKCLSGESAICLTTEHQPAMSQERQATVWGRCHRVCWAPGGHGREAWDSLQCPACDLLQSLLQTRALPSSSKDRMVVTRLQGHSR